MKKMVLGLCKKSFFIGLMTIFVLATATAQPEIVVIDMDQSLPIFDIPRQGSFVSESYQIPAYELYSHSWCSDKVVCESLTIPFFNNQLKIVVSQANSPFFFPCQGNIVRNFSTNVKKTHYGVDIQMGEYDPVVACFDGVVRLVRTFDNYGKVVIIRHYNGLETIYAHLNQVLVNQGQKVIAGEEIGSGITESDVLHFETRFFYQPLDVELFIDKETHRLLSDTLVLIPEYVVFDNQSSKVELGRFSNSSSQTALPDIYVVKAGDTLSKIAKIYNLSVEKILKINNMQETSVLKIGQKIKLR